MLGFVGRWPVVLTWGLLGFGAEYGLFLRLRGGAVDAWAPFVAAALLLAGELGFESIRGGLGWADRRLVLDWAAAILAASGCTALAGGFLLVVSGSAKAGLALEGAGVAAGVLTVAILVRIAAARARPPARGS